MPEEPGRHRPTPWAPREEVGISPGESESSLCLGNIEPGLESHFRAPRGLLKQFMKLRCVPWTFTDLQCPCPWLSVFTELNGSK